MTRERGRERIGEREREEGTRSFLKENQELEYIFAPPDSHEEPQKLGKSTLRDEGPAEADPSESGYKESGAHDGGSDGWEKFG
jgi:hypothetical protein